MLFEQIMGEAAATAVIETDIISQNLSSFYRGQIARAHTAAFELDQKTKQKLRPHPFFATDQPKFHTPYSTFHIPYPIFQIPYSIFHVPYPISHIPYPICHITCAMCHVPCSMFHISYHILETAKRNFEFRVDYRIYFRCVRCCFLSENVEITGQWGQVRERLRGGGGGGERGQQSIM